jgi:hypothetical protein
MNNVNLTNFLLVKKLGGNKIRYLIFLVQVYCYGMLTNNPKEYITLKSGPQHNFAEYYHRRLGVRFVFNSSFIYRIKFSNDVFQLYN